MDSDNKRRARSVIYRGAGAIHVLSVHEQRLSGYYRRIADALVDAGEVLAARAPTVDPRLVAIGRSYAIRRGWMP